MDNKTADTVNKTKTVWVTSPEGIRIQFILTEQQLAEIDKIAKENGISFEEALFKE